MRRAFVPVLLVLTGVLLSRRRAGAVDAQHVYDSSTFARRATSILDSQAVRQEAAER